MLWIKSSQCTQCAPPVYNGQKSSTYRSQGQIASPIQYIDGTSILGFYCSDDVTIGSLSMPNFVFTEASYVNRTRSTLHGVLGLSFPSSQPIDHFFTRLNQTSDPASAPVFGYGIEQNGQYGWLTVGAIDIGRYSGDLTWYPVVSNQQWLLQTTAFFVGDTQLTSIPNMRMMFDTGTSLTMFPLNVAKALNEAMLLTPILPATDPNNLPQYGMPCFDGVIPKNLPNITFSFQGASQGITITPREYMYIGSISGNLYCFSTIIGNFGDGLAIFGNALLRR
eukprot:jgi/Hompol1/2613/HPOL_006077-RA